MSYVNDSRYVKHKSKGEYILSGLQKEILRSICTTKDADYHSLQKEIKKTRTTIVQSLTPLRKHRYVREKKVHPERKISKLIFIVTPKGFYYALAFLDIDYDKVIEAQMGEKEMEKYNEYIKSVPDHYARKEFLVQTAKVLMKYNTFDRNGEFVTKNNQEALNQGVIYYLLELAKGNNFDPTTALGKDPMEALRKVCGHDELKETRTFLQNFKDNIDSIVKALS
jgi:hypothetical protein